MKILPFLKEVSQDMRIGAVMPSSRFAVRNIMRFVPYGIKTVLEYGPGDGVLTRQLLARLPADGRLVAIETNGTMCSEVEAIRDPRLVLVRDDATQAADIAARLGFREFDFVISGIPFSMLSAQTRRATVRMTHDLLSQSGMFLVYQTSPLMVPYLKECFDVHTAFEPRNVPPYFIMRASKDGYRFNGFSETS